MKAASGVIHSEMPQQTDGMMRGFQLWINLPAKEKMSEPGYQEFPPEVIPVVKTEDQQVKVLVGSYQGQQGPVKDPYTHVQYFDVTVNAGNTFIHDLDASLQGFVYVFEGDARIGNTELPQHSFAVLGDGNTLEVSTGNNEARFILVAGQPLNESIVQYGPFVMTTQEDIQQAFIDYREGKLVREKASFVTA